MKFDIQNRLDPATFEPQIHVGFKMNLELVRDATGYSQLDSREEFMSIFAEEFWPQLETHMMQLREDTKAGKQFIWDRNNSLVLGKVNET